MSDANYALSETSQPPNGLIARGFAEQHSSGIQDLATAQIQSRYTIARKFPRNLDILRQNSLTECKRPEFCRPDPKKNGSSVAIYSVPRGGVSIQGPTIRLAEMLARNWGNMGIDVHPVGEDHKQRIFLVVATDYENNLVSTEIVNVPLTIERSFLKDGEKEISVRTNSKNKSVYTVLGTEDDIAMKRNALISKARRNLILGFIPGWLLEECIQTVRATAAKEDAKDPDAAKRQLFDAFSSIGVRAEWLAEFIGHDGQLQPAQLEELRGYYGAIKEGYTTWSEIMATKDDDKDGSISDQIEKLIVASGRNNAQGRKLRSSYAGRPDELLKYLQDEAAKKADTGAAPQAQAQPETKAEPAKAEPAPAAAETQPQAQVAQVQAQQAPPPTAAPTTKAAPPPPPTDDTW